LPMAANHIIRAFGGLREAVEAGNIPSNSGHD
jgi:hypothetical protein